VKTFNIRSILTLTIELPHTLKHIFLIAYTRYMVGDYKRNGLANQCS